MALGHEVTLKRNEHDWKDPPKKLKPPRKKTSTHRRTCAPGQFLEPPVFARLGAVMKENAAAHACPREFGRVVVVEVLTVA